MNISNLKSKSFYLPTLLFIGFVLIYTLLFLSGENKYTSFERMLIQWDGQHYLSIARDGYEKYPCQYNRQYICGNVGWFPLYPMVGMFFSWLPFNMTWTMILISWVSFWLALLVLYQLVKMKFNESAALFSIIALLLFPSSFYFLTVFPYALYLLLAVLIFYCYEKEQMITVIILSGLLAVSYPSGLVIGLPLLYYLITNWKKIDSRKRIQYVFSIASIGVALLLYCSYYYFTFNDFFLYINFQSQSYYAHEAAFPLLTMYHRLSSMVYSDPVWIMLVLTIVLVLIFYRKKFDTGMLVYLFGILLFTPTAGTTDCYYRHIVVGFPLFILIGASVTDAKRKYFLLPYGIISCLLMYKIYLPLYKLGQLM